ncbi:MAG TPA: TetR/AcrR family transcriptional regulator [Chitinophagaceae bacterium]|jgi:AcrR family transcriptional regulator|nr:TetR/AcrR family transcriptional regulator [Chitinophagaceae bacterium]
MAKERILKKAHELFMRYGVRSVSMDDIAAQLGMSKKTLYQYYTDKEELVDAVVSALLENNRKQCLSDRQKSENAIHEIFQAFDMIQEMFTNMNPSIVFDLEKYHPAVSKKIQHHKQVFMYQVIKQNLERGIKEELYRPEINVDVLTRFRIESMMLAFNSEIFPNNRIHLVAIQQEILEHFLYGLATAKGHKLIQKYKQQQNLTHEAKK